MNIFYLSESPVEAARYMHDKHVNKMRIETAQMLSCAVHHHNKDWLKAYIRGRVYSPAYENHPSTVWVRSDREAYSWALLHFAALEEQCVLRGFKSLDRYEHLAETFKTSVSCIPLGDRWQYPPQCMPDKYKCSDTIQAYRRYYLGEKMYANSWTNPGIRPSNELWRM